MKKKWLALFLVAVLGTLTLETAACGTEQTATGEKEEEQTAWERYAKDDITLDWYVNYSWFATPWGNNLVSKTITDETGVDINFITPIGNETEKLNALIASDSLPDIITLGYWEPQVSELISGDMVYALNELAEEYNTDFFKVCDEDAVNWYTQEDGNLYCYPNTCVTPSDLKENEISSNETFLVRKDIYEAIGSPDMTTMEGFEAAVKKAVELYPEVDGEPLIPIGAQVFDNEGCVSFDKYLMNFLAVPWEKDGQFYDRFTDPEYISWLKFFRHLGEEGYLSNDIFVDTRTQMEEKLASGRYFCMLYQYTDMLSQQKTLLQEHPERVYIAVDGPKNSKGDDYTLPCNGVSGWTVTMISKNCKNPERALALMEYMMSEHGQKMIYLGVEGETYDMVDGKPVLKDDVKNLLNTDREKYDELYGADDAYWMLQDNVMQLQWKQELSPEIEKLEQWTIPYVVYDGQYDVQFPVDSDEANEDNKITRLWSQTLPQLLLAPTEESFDEIWQEFLDKRASYGFADVQRKKIEFMKEAKEKLGIE